MDQLQNSLEKVIAGIKIRPISAEESLEHDRQMRSNAAAEVRERLPEVFRLRGDSSQLPAAELLARVKREAYGKAVKGWNGAVSLVLCGPTDSGKSMAAAWAFRKLLGLGIRDGGQRWGLAQGLQWHSAKLLELSAREHPFGRGECASVAAARRATVLFLDDLGQEGDFGLLYEICNARYELARPTVITTFLNWDQLQERYKDAIVRRAVNMDLGTAIIVEAA